MQAFDQRLIGVRRQLQSHQRVLGVSINAKLHDDEFRLIGAQRGQHGSIKRGQVFAMARAAQQRDIQVVSQPGPGAFFLCASRTRIETAVILVQRDGQDRLVV